MLDVVLITVAVGVGATLAVDAWALVLKHAYGVTGLDYRLLGRWICHLPQGRFHHPGIAQTAPVAGEAALGWVAHYAIGIAFAAGLVAIAGEPWLRMPSLAPALLAGLITVLAPYFILQPAFGMGIAASRQPNPRAARLRSLINHLVFGVGLYAAARLLAAI